MTKAADVGWLQSPRCAAAIATLLTFLQKFQAVNYQTLKQKPNHGREPERKEMNHNLPSPKLCSAKPLGLRAVTTRWGLENKTQQKAGGDGESHP